MPAAVERDLSYLEDAPVVVVAERIIAAAPHEVWEVICDHEAWPRWFAAVRTCRATSDPPSGVGSTREVGLGAGVVLRERFLAWDQPERWAFTVTHGPRVLRSVVEEITLRPVDAGTEVTYRMALGPAAPLVPLVRSAKRAIARNLLAALAALEDEVGRRRPSGS
jgi:uncharacterized protein YndB with AHSA1/START domain